MMVTSIGLFTVDTIVRHTCTCDVNRETVFFVLYRQETMLRCCGGSGDGDGWSGGGFTAGCGCASDCGDGGQQRRRARWRRARQWRLGVGGDTSTVGATEDDGRRPPKYSRVSGRTTSTSVDDRRDDDDDDDNNYVAVVDERRPSAAAVGMADCWRRALKLSTGDGSSSASDGGVGNDDSGGTTTPPPARIRGPAPPMAVSNWTMISNSSLKDVDGDDLRDELVGYGHDVAAADVTSMVTPNDNRWTTDDDEGGGDTVNIVHECYY